MPGYINASSSSFPTCNTTVVGYAKTHIYMECDHTNGILSREWFEPPLIKDWMLLNGVADLGLNSLHRDTIFLGSQSQEVHPGPGQDHDSPLDFHKLISVTLL
ncbi:Sec-independent protein translocase protein TatA [Striga asiatica]|uniref:Sec-independent protein translocase protein TatA n=1 Tax=Striga asiatica TaxID=4170 RepID=A0A5A7R0R1_STRAF|nr:Sec-independent protein translocase protein TatA [Striga asiatica]